MIDVLSYRHWAVSQHFAQNFGLRALTLLSEGKTIEHLIKRHTPESILAKYDAILITAAESMVVNVKFDYDEKLYVATTKYGQNVAMVPVQGALTKNGDLCSWGMRDYVGMIERANASKKIASIVLDIESPGGTVDGTNELGLAVKNSEKPVVAFGDAMVASAAYWVASQASEIIANKNNATEFGSIGVLYIHENYQAYIQKEIGSVEIIRAPQSTDKALINPIEPLTNDLRAELKVELKAIAQEFIKTVKRGRGSKLNTGEENIFTGKMYPASVAKEYGMIDSLDTLQGAINRAGQLALNRSTSGGSASISNTTMFKSNLFSSIFGKSGKAENKEAPKSADENSLESADQKVSEIEAENAQLKKDKEAAEARAKEAEAKVTELTTQVSTLTSEKANLEKENAEQKKKLDETPAGNATTVIEAGEKPKHHSTSIDKEKKDLKNN